MDKEDGVYIYICNGMLFSIKKNEIWPLPTWMEPEENVKQNKDKCHMISLRLSILSKGNMRISTYPLSLFLHLCLKKETYFKKHYLGSQEYYLTYAGYLICARPYAKGLITLSHSTLSATPSPSWAL